MKSKPRKILVLGDIHIPWCDWNALKKASDWAKKNKPDLIIQVGDITDQKAWSRYQKDADDPSPKSEYQQMKAGMRRLHKLFPKMIILLGNHDRRVLAKAAEAGIPAEMFKFLDELFPYKGWKWMMGDRPFIVGDMVFVHGDEMGGTCAQKANNIGKSLIQGHSHKASITYLDVYGFRKFAMEVGCLIDPKTIAFRYSAKNPKTSFIGFAVIEDGVPTLIPSYK